MVEEGKQYYEGSIKEDAYDWNLPSAVFFSMTIISTIGYGTFTPQTAGGRVFTMVFAIASITYFGYFLTITADRVIYFIKWVARKWRPDIQLSPSRELKIIVAVAFGYVLAMSAMGPVFAGWD